MLILPWIAACKNKNIAGVHRLYPLGISGSTPRRTTFWRSSSRQASNSSWTKSSSSFTDIWVRYLSIRRAFPYSSCEFSSVRRQIKTSYLWGSYWDVSRHCCQTFHTILTRQFLLVAWNPIARFLPGEVLCSCSNNPVNNPVPDSQCKLRRCKITW